MTGNNCILDTSIVIHTFKNPSLLQKLASFAETFIPIIVIGELHYGAYRSANPGKHLAQIREFVANCIVLNADAVTADIYGEVKTGLKNKGKPIPENDIWIAAIALQYNLPLYTTDNHFSEIESIQFV